MKFDSSLIIQIQIKKSILPLKIISIQIIKLKDQNHLLVNLHKRTKQIIILNQKIKLMNLKRIIEFLIGKNQMKNKFKK